MKKKIQSYFYLIGGISVLFTAIFSSFVFYNLLEKQVQQDIKMTAQILSNSYAYSEDIAQLNENVDEIRITLISPEGQVIFDTDGEASKMENHKERPEVLDAIQVGWGKADRRSATFKQDTFYYAVKLIDGNILRVAKDTNSIAVVFTSVLLSLVIVVLFVFAMCSVVAGALTRRIISPIEEMVERINAQDICVPYDELVPFSRALKQRNDSIQNQVELLNIQKQQVQHLTDNMNEGLILLDANNVVLSVNASAIKLLGESENSFIGKNIFYLSRNATLEQCVNSAVNGKSKSLDFFLNNTYVQIFASTVYNQGDITGVMCFLLDITEKKQNEKMRREFTANVSHELKTPLTSICGYAELLAGGTVKKIDSQEFGITIYKESMRLLSLISDIIKLSELDEAVQNNALEKLNLKEIVKNCVSTLEPFAKKQDVTISIKGQELEIIGDYKMIEQLVRNLIDNAIRYNKPDGTIEISVEKDTEQTLLLIKDTGIGIDNADQTRVFERFYRVDKSRSKATGGTGLGLAIVKHVAEYHGAKFQLQSQLNVGTEISIFFPKASE